MTLGTGMRLVGLALLLAVAAPCAEPTVSEPTPQPAAQARIEQVVASIAAANRGGPDDEIPAMAEQLQQLMDDDRESLLLQLALYLGAHPGNEQAMGAALLIDYYGFTNEEKVAAFAPHLDTHVGRLRPAMWDVLSTVDPEAVERVHRLERYLAREEPVDKLALERARGEVDALSRAAAWWVRLYAARVVRTRPELGSPEVVGRLRSDSHEAVRQAVGG